MIWNEIRNRIEAKGDIHESKNNSKNKKMQEYQNQKGERVQLLARRTVTSKPAQWNKRPISGHANPRSSESDLVSVCVKGTARACKQCA